MFRIPLTRPAIGPAEHRAVAEVLDSGMLSEGAWTRELEERLARFVGTKHAIAVTSCTTGLELTLRGLGIGPGDEVLVPDYTYPATASAVAQVGARPVLVDIDPESMLIDLDKATEALTPKTRALLPVSLFGNPLDAPAMLDFCSARKLDLLEDAACSLGAEQHHRRVGSFARASVFSLHPRKTITSGEGGIITTDDDDLADWLRCSKHFGVSSKQSGPRPEFSLLGTNAKLSNVLAAIALEQLKRIDTLLANRRSLARNYQALLRGVTPIRLPATTPGGLHAYQSFCVFVPDRDRVLAQLRECGIEAQIGTYALHREPAFRDSTRCEASGVYPGSLHAFEHCLALPIYHGMELDDQEEVVQHLDRILHGRPPARRASPMAARSDSTCAAS